MLTNDERAALRDIADRLDHLTHSKLIAEQSAKLRAIAAPRVATVGELLATAPIGAVVEESDGKMRHRIDGDGYMESQMLMGASWSHWEPFASLNLRAPASIVDPASRGPIGEG